MGRTIHYLDSYPFEELKQWCENYIYSIDWDKVSGGIDTDKVTWFDVSGCVGLFSHLRLAEDYRLVCYMTSEHHGMLGQVAALKKGRPEQATHKGVRLGFNVQLPRGAADPMEVIFHDDSPEGYLEAVLFSQFVKELPDCHFRHYTDREVILSPPADLAEKWDVFLPVAHMHPKLIEDGNKATLYIFTKQYGSMFAPADGCDRIILSQCNFDEYGFEYFLHRPRPGKFREHPANYLKKDYSRTKRCCLFRKSEICVAKEK